MCGSNSLYCLHPNTEPTSIPIRVVKLASWQVIKLENWQVEPSKLQPSNLPSFNLQPSKLQPSTFQASTFNLKTRATSTDRGKKAQDSVD
jgi:hypothetical protein